MFLERLHHFSKCQSSELSRLIIAGSGRTNRTITLIAQISLTTGVAVFITSAAISVAWFGFEAVPRGVADWFTYPTVESLAQGGSTLIGSLGTGLVARGVGHVARRCPTWGRITAVTVTHIGFLALFLFLWYTFIGPLFGDDDEDGNQAMTRTLTQSLFH